MPGFIVSGVLFIKLKLHAWAAWSSSAGHFEWILWVAVTPPATSTCGAEQLSVTQYPITCMLTENVLLWGGGDTWVGCRACSGIRWEIYILNIDIIVSDQSRFTFPSHQIKKHLKLRKGQGMLDISYLPHQNNLSNVNYASISHKAMVYNMKCKGTCCISN